MFWKSIQRPTLVASFKINNDPDKDSPLKRLTKIFSETNFNCDINNKRGINSNFKINSKKDLNMNYEKSYLQDKSVVVDFWKDKKINFINSKNGNSKNGNFKNENYKNENSENGNFKNINSKNENINSILNMLLTNDGICEYKILENEILLRFSEIKHAIDFYKKNIKIYMIEFLPEYRFSIYKNIKSENKKKNNDKNDKKGLHNYDFTESFYDKSSEIKSNGFQNNLELQNEKILKMRIPNKLDYKNKIDDKIQNNTINSSYLNDNIYNSTNKFNFSVDLNNHYMLFIRRVYAYTKLSKIFTINEIMFFKEKICKNDFDFIFENAISLSVGAQTNVLMQNLLEKLDSASLIRFIKGLGRDFIIIACTKYGAYTVQKLLSLNLNKEHKNLILEYVDGNDNLNNDNLNNDNTNNDVLYNDNTNIDNLYNENLEIIKPEKVNNDLLYMIMDSRGNYSFQKIIPFDREKFKNILLRYLERILDSEFGFVVIKSCMTNFQGSKYLFKRRFFSIKKSYSRNVCDYFNELNDY
ncbi:hypothetical protein DMUE_4619 [Dictyocoela muelleri]|nr:hypothetical protein DMUE_4619 [Dictyocoela muelleri]